MTEHSALQRNDIVRVSDGDIACCQWLEPGGTAAAMAISDFLQLIGIEIEIAPIDCPMFVPGLAIVDGRIRIDPAIPAYPGDMLHEAGHIAVVEPGRRVTLCAVGEDPGEEMASIAWSVAAAKACGVSLPVLFMTAGYRGGAQAMIDAFADDAAPFGVPLLQYWGMAAGRGEPRGYPEMLRWLR